MEYLPLLIFASSRRGMAGKMSRWFPGSTKVGDRDGGDEREERNDDRRETEPIINTVDAGMIGKKTTL